MSNCSRHPYHFEQGCEACESQRQRLESSFAAPAGSAVGGDFYNGVEWLACWLLDNAEGETITEEQLRPWAAKAWEAHLKRQNDQAQA